LADPLKDVKGDSKNNKEKTINSKTLNLLNLRRACQAGEEKYRTGGGQRRMTDGRQSSDNVTLLLDFRFVGPRKKVTNVYPNAYKRGMLVVITALRRAARQHHGFSVLG